MCTFGKLYIINTYIKHTKSRVKKTELNLTYWLIAEKNPKHCVNNYLHSL